MILADTSVWIDHLRAGDAALVSLLDAGRVLVHPFVIGEVALGTQRQRDGVLVALSDLPHAEVATDTEVLRLIEAHGLSGCGIGYVDAHLLASVRLSHGAVLWTRDKRLHTAGSRMGLVAAPGRLH